MIQSLRHYWQTQMAVVLSAAVATAVLTGALIVGDSVRGTLRDLTLERLGSIEVALLSEGFFRQELSAALGNADSTTRIAAPVILMQGAASSPDSGRRASRVGIQGVAAGFDELFAESSEALQLEPSSPAVPPVVINEALAHELGVEVGQPLLLTLERPSEVPRELLVGDAEPSSVLRRLRGEVLRVLPDRGIGRFSLRPQQTTPLNVFVSLPVLQRALDQEDRVNAVLVGADGEDGGEGAGGSAAEIEQQTAESLSLRDLGLTVEEESSFVQIESREIVLRPGLVDQIERLAARQGWSVQPVVTYLANQTRLADGAGSAGSRELLPYSTVVALGDNADERLPKLELIDGTPAPELGAGEILINSWAAEDLGAAVGDALEVTFFEVGPREVLVERRQSFTLRGVVSLEGPGADPDLAPDFPGVHDAEDMSDWDPTFPVDLSLIEPRDEQYWDLFRAAPKLFLSLAEARQLFASRFGDLTALRLTAADVTPAALAASLSRELPRAVSLAEAGFAVQPVRARGLESSSGATDFEQIFLGFSVFLIISAALLVGLFFRLGVERRAAEVGLFLAIGYSQKRVERRFLKEGGVVGGLGVVLGLAGAVAYGEAMMLGLRTLWVGAVGSTALELHLVPTTLLIGAACSYLVVLIAISRGVRRLGKVAVVRLLRGQATQQAAPTAGRRVRVWTGTVAALVGGVGLVASAFLEPAQAAGLFFLVGASLLVLGLSLFVSWLRRRPRSGLFSSRLVTARMAVANAGLNPGRSLLSVALVASACFVIVAVGSYGLRFGDEVQRLDSGAGGYTLVAESDIPVYQDLATVEGRFELGFSDSESELMSRSTVVPFRVLPGDDTSCLNLYQPTAPRLLGVPPEQRQRGGFRFSKLLTPAGGGEPPENPWQLLEEELGDDVVPAFGDANSVQWILKSGLGQDVLMENEQGQTIRLRIVGLLQKSLFQSELLIAEEQLLRHFPSRSGYGYFLIAAPLEEREEVETTLENRLQAFGFDSLPTEEKLQRYQAVENTYLGTFQLLGGLGLLLGTVGLSVILLRNVLERRSELATLRAIGFPRARLGWVVVLENAVVLVAGLLLGSASALLAVAPHLVEAEALVPWAALALTLAGVLLTGLLASVAAVRQSLRSPLLPALRAD